MLHSHIESDQKSEIESIEDLAHCLQKYKCLFVDETLLQGKCNSIDLAHLATAICKAINSLSLSDLNQYADTDSNSILHLAVMTANVDLVKALLIKGVNARQINAYGDTPFSLAVGLMRYIGPVSLHEEIVQYLLAKLDNIENEKNSLASELKLFLEEKINNNWKNLSFVQQNQKKSTIDLFIASHQACGCDWHNSSLAEKVVGTIIMEKFNSQLQKVLTQGFALIVQDPMMEELLVLYLLTSYQVINNKILPQHFILFLNDKLHCLSQESEPNHAAKYTKGHILMPLNSKADQIINECLAYINKESEIPKVFLILIHEIVHLVLDLNLKNSGQIFLNGDIRQKEIQLALHHDFINALQFDHTKFSQLEIAKAKAGTVRKFKMSGNFKGYKENELSTELPALYASTYLQVSEKNLMKLMLPRLSKLLKKTFSMISSNLSEKAAKLSIALPKSSNLLGTIASFFPPFSLSTKATDEGIEIKTPKKG